MIFHFHFVAPESASSFNKQGMMIDIQHRIELQPYRRGVKYDDCNLNAFLILYLYSLFRF